MLWLYVCWVQVYEPTNIKTRTERKVEIPDRKISEIELEITSETVLFFDMDGTIVDTNLANYLSYKKAIQSITNSDYHITYNPDKRFNRSNLKKEVLNLSEVDYKRIIQKKEEYYVDFLNEIKLNNEVSNILFKYSTTNKTVLVTNCRKDRALQILNYFQLSDKFDYIFFREFDGNEKINKYKNAINKLNISPNKVIVFENERTEINDAIYAGIDENKILSL